MRATRSAAELLVGSNSSGNLQRPPSSGSGGGRPGSGFEKFRGGANLRHVSRTRSAFDHHGLCKHEFGHALGDHGLTWTDTIVTNVQGQAFKKGIKPGWKIYQIDGQTVHSSEDIWMKFQDAKWQWRSAHVTFVTDMGAIRGDASKQRAAKLQAEAERLARLPFDGAHDTRHLEQVWSEYKFQGLTEQPEARSISAQQIAKIMEWTSEKCHRWRDPTTRQKLNIDMMTLNQLNHWLIKPATKEKDCSFVEMLMPPGEVLKRPPNWYVISWWGERLSNLLKCLETHNQIRGNTPVKSSFWIAAMANRQHSIPEAYDERRAIYTKALEQTRYRTLLVLDGVEDKTGPATAFTRSWCNYEMLLTLDMPMAQLDVAAVQNGKTMIMTQSLTEEEEDMEKVAAGSGVKQKEQREKAFSIDIIKAGLTVKIENAQATNPADGDRILNGIAGRELDSEPPEKCDEYVKANKQLRALFAITCWQRVISPPGEDQMKDLQSLLSECLRGDIWRDSLTLSLSNINNGAEKLALLERCLPPNLKKLSVNFSGMNLSDEQVVGFAQSLPSFCEELNLNLIGNVDVSNIGIANFMNNIPPKLRDQNLKLGNTGVSKDFQDRSDSLDGIKQVIYEEAQRGSLCVSTMLVPSGTRGRMLFSVERQKI